MAQGDERRAAVTDTLRGQAGSRSQQQSVSKAVSGFGGVNLPRAPQDTFSNRIAAQVSQFADGQLLKMQKREQERSLVEGQLAAAQGKSFEEVQAGGDRWALEGYRITQAEAMGASMQQAALDEIRKGAFEQSPEDYRGVISDRIQSMLDGIDDDRMRENLKANLASGAERLMQAHAKAHVQYKEEQAFDTIKHTIGTIAKSGDPNVLAAMFDGTAPEAAVLGKPNMHKAITAGIVEGLRDDDWAAYNAAQKAGFLEEGNLTYGQMDAISDARRASGNRIQRANAKRQAEEQAKLDQELATKDIDPDDYLQRAVAMATPDVDYGSVLAMVRGKEQYAENFRRYESGELSVEELVAANDVIVARTGANLGTANARSTKIANATQKAFNTLVQDRQNKAVLAEAATENRVGELSTKQQETWKSIVEEGAIKAAQNAAATGDLNPNMVGQAASAMVLENLTQQSIVDSQLKKEVSLFKDPETWTDTSGVANEGTVNTVAKLLKIKETAPEMLDKYLTSVKDETRFNAIVSRLDTESLGTILGQYDLGDPESPAVAMIAKAVQDTQASVIRGGQSTKDHNETVELAKEMIARGNPTGRFLGGAGTNSIGRKIAGISAWEGTNAEKRRSFSNTDFEAVDDQVELAALSRVDFMGKYGAADDPESTYRDAMEFVQRAGSVVGSQFVMPAPGQASLYLDIFQEHYVPGRSDGGQVNTAITRYLMSDESGLGWDDPVRAPEIQSFKRTKNGNMVAFVDGEPYQFTAADVRKAWIAGATEYEVIPSFGAPIVTDTVNPREIRGSFSRWLGKTLNPKTKTSITDGYRNPAE